MDRRCVPLAALLLAFFLLTAAASDNLQQEKDEVALEGTTELILASEEELGFQAAGEVSGELEFTERKDSEDDDANEDEEDGDDDSATNEYENRGQRRIMQAPYTPTKPSDYVKTFALLANKGSLPVLTGGGSSAGSRFKRIKGRKGGKGKGRHRAAQVQLRSAINSANQQGGKAVTFVLSSDISLSSELPLLIGSLTVIGACKDSRGLPRPCVIDGRRRFPIFKASIQRTFCQLNISNLILQNAKGGAYTADAQEQIPASCELVAQRVTFRNNRNDAGGAVFMLGKYYLNKCIFEGNAADGDGGAILAGDQSGFYLAPALGSYVSASGVILRTTFKNNVAGLNPNWLNPGSGGAIAHFGGPKLEIFRSVFASNKAGTRPLTAPGPRSPTGAVSGGAIHFRAGDNITVTLSSFTGNSAPEGGAVYAAPLLQFLQWNEPIGPNIWGRASFCRPVFTYNKARKFPDVSINATYAYDKGLISARFCPRAPAGTGTSSPLKVRITSKKCLKCRLA